MDIRCDCGGTLKPAKLASFDLTEYLGIKAVAHDVRGLRCNRCGWTTLPGKTIDLAMHVAAVAILEMDERIPADLARYLRKYLGLTQQELAKRMGITRKTVNQWETGAPISPQHDLILRALVYGARLPDFLRPRAATLDHVRTAPPRARHPLIVERLDRAA